MSVRIRLSKVGKTHQVSFRIVACDSRVKRDGKFLENLGFYNPHKKVPEDFKLNEARYDAWLKRGAKPTEGVLKLLAKRPVPKD